MSKPRMMYYTDARHPLVYMYEPPMQKEEFESTIDEVAGTSVDAVMFCLGDGRTMMHDTKAGELWGHNVQKWTHAVFRRGYQNVKNLIDSGNDPLSIVCNRAHQKGILLYPTLLVQLPSGIRGGPGYDIRSSDFRLDNPQFEIGASGNIDPKFAGIHCADFKHEEVRNERFAVIEEVLCNYPVDGIELQLNFWPFYFQPNEILAGTKIMTDWISKIYALVQQSGKDRELVITIPAKITDCLSRGLDVKDWLRLGIVDVLVGQPIQRPDLMDPNSAFIKYDLEYLNDLQNLVKATNGTKCRVHASINSTLHSDRLTQAPIEMIRAAAVNYWEQGVDGMYINWITNWPYKPDFYEKLRELPHPDIMNYKDKFYHVPTATPSDPNGKLNTQLPAKFKTGSPLQIEMTINDDIASWHEVDRIYEVLLRFRITSATELDRFRFKLNGKEIPLNLMRQINKMYAMDSARYRVFGQWYIFNLTKEYWPAKGSNIFEVTMLNHDSEVIKCPNLRDVELEIKYLMGKNFHRDFIDLDLGPYDS